MLQSKTNFIMPLPKIQLQKLYIIGQIVTKKIWDLLLRKKSPNGKIMESDVVIVKNYLSKDEL